MYTHSKAVDQFIANSTLLYGMYAILPDSRRWRSMVPPSYEARENATTTPSKVVSVVKYSQHFGSWDLLGDTQYHVLAENMLEKHTQKMGCCLLSTRYCTHSANGIIDASPLLLSQLPSPLFWSIYFTVLAILCCDAPCGQSRESTRWCDFEGVEGAVAEVHAAEILCQPTTPV